MVQGYPGGMPPADVRSLVVMGVSGSGKSTLAAAVAAQLHRPFVDADDLHSAANISKMAAGTPLDDFDRADWLDAVGIALARPDRPVVACSALARRYRDQLRSHRADAVFVFLHGDEGELLRRLRSRSAHFMPASLLSSQLAALEVPGPDELVITVDITIDPAAQVAEVLAGLADLIAAPTGPLPDQSLR